MPTYDYKCNACKHRFELFQSMKDAPKRKCPKCAKNALERLIGTGAAILFKGSGFYETDYRSESYKKAADAEKAPAPDSKTDSKPETKSDSKSDAKPDAKSQSTPKQESKPESKSAPKSSPSKGGKPSPSKSSPKPASKSSKHRSPSK
ncbi:MAG: zinc ribbon domain-containing protein [Phycisphaeraceae bacterium]|nr:MAG: zinc ribbon domain-containing protein [Phycisphaeraceae bacterium]